MVRSAEKYPYSSINQIIENKNAFIFSEEIMDWYYIKLNVPAAYLVSDKNFIVL